MGRPDQSHGFTLIELMVVVALLGFLQYARSTAVQNKTSLVACFDDDQWMLKAACSDADTTSLRTLEPPANVDIAADPESVGFRSNGTAASAVTVIGCHDDDFANGFTLTVQNSGNIRL